MADLNEDQASALRRLKRAIDRARTSGLVELLHYKVGMINTEEFCKAVEEWPEPAPPPPPLPHLFKFVEVDGRTLINFRREDTASHLGRVIDEDRQHILHVTTGNDYCLVECQSDAWGVWAKDDRHFIVASVHGTGEVRWAVTPNDVKYFREHGGTSIRQEEMQQVIEHFKL